MTPGVRGCYAADIVSRFDGYTLAGRRTTFLRGLALLAYCGYTIAADRVAEELTINTGIGQALELKDNALFAGSKNITFACWDKANFVALIPRRERTK